MSFILIGIIGILTALGVATLVLTPILPLMAALGAVLLLFGAALLAIVAPLSILVNLMGIIAEVGMPGVQALLNFIQELGKIIPEIAAQIALGVISFAQALSSGGEAIFGAISTLVGSALDALIVNMPKFFTVISLLLNGILDLIIKYAPKIVEAGFTILMSLLRGIRDNIQEIVEVGADIIINFMKGIENKMPALVDEAFNLIIVFIDTLGTTIRDKTPILVDHIWTMAENIVKGLWEGLKHFIENGKEKLTNIGKFVIEKLEDVFGIPHGSLEAGAKRFLEMGGQIITGMINGFKEGLGSIGKAVEEVGENIKEGFCKFFGIHSPSRLMRDEVGKYIVDGIAVGIKENTSAEEAARIKAQNIANAFKDEINKIDLSQTTKDLELKLWNSKYGDQATDVEYASMQLENTKQYVENLERKQELAKREYEITSETLGADSDEAIKAYQSYLEAQINYIDKTKEYNSQLEEYAEIQKSYVQEQKDLEDSYYAYIVTNGRTLKELGYTNAQIQKAAKQATGFDPLASQNKMEDKVKEATLNSMQTVNTVYQENAENTFGSLEPEFKSYGEKYGTNLANGLESQTGLVSTQSEKLVDTSLDVLKDNKEDYYKAGLEAGKAYSSGLSYYANTVLNSDTGLNSKTNSQLKAAYAAKSSEMRTKYSSAINDIAKSYGVDTGVAFDMLKANARGASYGTGTTYNKSELESDYKELLSYSEGTAINHISKIIKEGGDLSGLSIGKSTISSSTSSSVAKSVSSSSKSSSESSGSSSSSTTVNYTQNITSPKAIGNTEIYRQTKTLLSSVSGTIGGQMITSAVKKIAAKSRCNDIRRLKNNDT